MTVRTQAEMQTQIDTLLANNTSGGITPADLRSVCQDLVDTAEDRWLDDTVSPQYNNGNAVDALITSLLADNTTGDISPDDVRGGEAYTTTGKSIDELESYEKSSGLWGSDNGSKLTFAAWLQYNDVGGNNHVAGILSNGVSTSDYETDLSFYDWDDLGNKIRFVIDGLITSYTLGKATHGLVIGDWFAFMLSMDYSGSGVPPVIEIWVQKKDSTTAYDVYDGTSWANGPQTIEFDYGTGYVGSNNTYGDPKTFDIAEVFIDGPDTAVDWSDSAERLKFIDSTGNPVNLGATGTGITGTQPKIYAPDGDLTNNRGSAGDFTEVGTISDSVTTLSGVSTRLLLGISDIVFDLQ